MKNKSKKILLVNLSIHLKKDFIDYPYFVNQPLYLLREILSQEGFLVSIYDAFCTTYAPVVKQTEKEYILGSNIGLTKTITKINPDITIILNSPFLNLHSETVNKEIVELLKLLKSKSSKTILADCFIGGMHYYDYNINNIKKRYKFDAICKHECDVTILNAINKLKSYSKPIFKKNLDDLPIIKYSKEEFIRYNKFLSECQKSGITDLINFDDKTIPLLTSRGCIYNCIFCSSRIYGRTYRQHSIAYLDKQLSYFVKEHKLKKVIFLDDLLNPNKKRLSEIINLLKKYDILCDIPNGLRADYFDKNQISLLKSLTSWLKISAETGSSKTMKRIGKQLDKQHVELVAGWCKEENFPLYIHFIIGFPFEKIRDMNKTLKFALFLNDKYDAIPLMQFASPIKGSELCKYYKQLDNDYLSYFEGSKHKNCEVLKGLRNSYNLAFKKKKLEKIIINVTYKCNNQCIFCAVGDRKRVNGNLKYQMMALKSAREKGAVSVDFDGGEPTTSENLVQLIKEAKKLCYSNINLTTNGRLLSDSNVAKQIYDSEINSILFSLHGPNQKVHESITGVKGSFIETLMGIDNILNLNKKNIDVGINITLTNTNTPFLSDFFEFLCLIGIKKVNIQYLTPFGTAKKEQLPNNYILKKQLNKIISKYNGSININLVNFLPCFIVNKNKDNLYNKLVSDFSKNQRNMLFIDTKEQNLAIFLSNKRNKKHTCIDCVYHCICGGYWNFEK